MVNVTHVHQNVWDISAMYVDSRGSFVGKKCVGYDSNHIQWKVQNIVTLDLTTIGLIGATTSIIFLNWDYDLEVTCPNGMAMNKINFMSDGVTKSTSNLNWHGICKNFHIFGVHESIILKDLTLLVVI